MENNITMKDCEELFKKFLKHTGTAEQHEFAVLARVHMMLEHTLKTWKDPIDQKEARAMFRVVLGLIGGNTKPYQEV